MEVRRPHTAKKGLLVEAETPAGTVPEKFPAAHGKRRVIFTFLALRAQSRSTAPAQINSDPRGIRLAVSFGSRLLDSS